MISSSLLSLLLLPLLPKSSNLKGPYSRWYPQVACFCRYWHLTSRWGKGCWWYPSVLALTDHLHSQDLIRRDAESQSHKCRWLSTNEPLVLQGSWNSIANGGHRGRNEPGIFSRTGSDESASLKTRPPGVPSLSRSTCAQPWSSSCWSTLSPSPFYLALVTGQPLIPNHSHLSLRWIDLYG